MGIVVNTLASMRSRDGASYRLRRYRTHGTEASDVKS